MYRENLNDLQFNWKDKPNTKPIKEQSRLRDSVLLQKFVKMIFVFLVVLAGLWTMKYGLEGVISFYKGTPHTSMHEWAQDFKAYKEKGY